MKKLISVFMIMLILTACTVAIPSEEEMEKNGALNPKEEVFKEDLPKESFDEALKEEISETEALEEKDESPDAPIKEETPALEEKPEFSQTAIDSLPNDASGWGFVKRAGEYPEFTKGQRDMMEKYNCIYEGNNEEKVLYLTFDEGYENGYTGLILDTLKEKNVPAAFFITGPYLEKNDDLIRRMIEEGHIVGNHTVNHPNMPSLKTKEAMQKEMLSLDLKFYEKYGSHMTYFRPPEGAYSERSLAATNDAGYTTVLWSFAYKDWETDNQKGAQHAFDSVVPYLHNGCVMLLHAVSKDNTEALGRIIDEARNLGYVFKSLDEFVF